ncbi:hypothetical protein CE91St62_32890 [Lachnospiraceae bacterium]|uniref:tripartite tricarboxylate transporter TctB family protein n=1 Tax=Extibacter sp. GGCC_0201 TaxID=2731209 RepID=UPI001AA1CD2A|nr:tripartite tricarboxylate transporter TctB family protein [Extibacter sp. GGCC_0201]MBO1721548.1 tripartite tricarboxylate transporter TctB family protein [Extibacter sp. GGCC_0201]BDF35227.1 hypothetical protein CE91St61_33020 [Lachnospiraceae bacterium]BDF39228.1 hypothetical protein CE91St62_32890 [Lachnospiraceae bacterium]
MQKKLKGDTVPGMITIFIGIFFLVKTLATDTLSFVATTSDGVPGAGFFPCILSGALICSGIILMIRGLRQNGEKQYVALDAEMRGNIKILLLTVAGLAVFLAFWYLTDLFIVGVLLFAVFLNKLYERKWKYTIMYAVVFTVFIYLVFMVAFSIGFTV